MNRVLGAVLAGGASSRFGSDKAAALLDGRMLLDHARAALAGVVAEVVVVGRPGGVADLPRPGLGPLGGIAGALDHAGRQGFASVLTIGCDMPDVPAALVAALLERAPACCRQAPILGHWPVAVASGLLDRLEGIALSPAGGAKDHALSIRRWAETIDAVTIDTPAPLANINTAADLLTA